MNVQKLTTKQILEKNMSRKAPGRLKELKVVLHNVRSMHNVGAAFRSADAFGISELFLTGFTPRPPQPEITKTAIGAEEYVDWTGADDAEQLLNQMHKQNYQVIGVEQTSKSRALPEFTPDSNQEICLLFGNEVTGLDDTLFPSVDYFVEIPQYGNKHSLNVSVTVGITLYAFLVKCWN